jgi:DNA primase
LEYLLDQASAGVNFGRDDSRRQFLEKMLAVAARIPDVAARDQFADRIAHKARITEEVVRAEIRKAAVARKTEVTPREMPGAGQLKDAEKALIWWIIQRPGEARVVLDSLEKEDLAGLSARQVFEVAQSLGTEHAEHLPSALIQRLSTMDAQLVTRIASEPTPPVKFVEECGRAVKRLRFDRERAAIQREIDRLQGVGAAGHDAEIDALWKKKKSVLQRMEELA